MNKTKTHFEYNRKLINSHFAELQSMKAILVFIDGTTCDMRHRIPLQGTDKTIINYINRGVTYVGGSVETGNCIWPDIPEKYWEQAIHEIIAL